MLTGSGSARAAPGSSDGYGPLFRTPRAAALPAGSSYRIVAQSGVTSTTDGASTASARGVKGCIVTTRDRWATVWVPA